MPPPPVFPANMWPLYPFACVYNAAESACNCLPVALTTCLHSAFLILLALSVSLSESVSLSSSCQFISRHFHLVFPSLSSSLSSFPLSLSQPPHTYTSHTSPLVILCFPLSRDDFLSTVTEVRAKDKGAEEQLLISKLVREG